MRKLGLAVLMTVALLGARGLQSPARAGTAAQCQGGPTHFTGMQKTMAGSNALTLVRATIDKQSTDLCLNPGYPPQPSADSSWVMITQLPPTANDYIQHGFWNCQSWCNYGAPGGETGGQVHEFFEWNNGNLFGYHRIDDGAVSSGSWEMEIRYTAGSNARFDMFRGGFLTGTVYDTNGWRDWSLYGATFQVLSESWDIGDQNGGTASDKEVMKDAQRAVNFGIVNYQNMGTPCTNVPDSHGGDFNCTAFTDLTTNDSVRTWTISR